MSNPLFAVRWASDQVEDEWIRPAVACRWNQPEGDMAVDDELMREALLERVLGETTLLVQRTTAIEMHLHEIDGQFVRFAAAMDQLTAEIVTMASALLAAAAVEN